MARDRRPPAERVRERLARVAGGDAAARLPDGYQRLGRVLVLRLPPSLRPFFPEIGAAWQEELGVETVLVRTGPIEGELRRPATQTIAGGPTETEVVEFGSRYTFDAARIMFAAGNRVERRRVADRVERGEIVADLFAGIGYFTVPIARTGRPRRVYAVEKNPVAVRYLALNVARNGVADRVAVVPGDNRSVALPVGDVDRVVLGWLPSAVPWVPRALGLARRSGAWLHVHLVVDAREARPRAEREVEAAVRRARPGARIADLASRAVKPYGPGRTHAVVDVRVEPGDGRTEARAGGRGDPRRSKDDAGTGI